MRYTKTAFSSCGNTLTVLYNCSNTCYEDGEQSYRNTRDETTEKHREGLKHSATSTTFVFCELQVLCHEFPLWIASVWNTTITEHGSTTDSWYNKVIQNTQTFPIRTIFSRSLSRLWAPWTLLQFPSSRIWATESARSREIHGKRPISSNVLQSPHNASTPFCFETLSLPMSPRTIQMPSHSSFWF